MALCVSFGCQAGLRGHGSVGKKPQRLGWKVPLLPYWHRGRGQRLAAIRLPPPACLQQELPSEASPGLEAMLDDVLLYLHLSAGRKPSSLQNQRNTGPYLHLYETVGKGVLCKSLAAVNCLLILESFVYDCSKYLLHFLYGCREKSRLLPHTDLL